ncbi:MAG: hypothetical protein M1375_02890 [Candidatus Thermoplasmatota archaeon]|jgi:hypothetical protein|nr:hypothetical protein [Candidatus Thermoplasmatota archaeon]MCL5790900.1 hypothetical protein [Candidatus Thermoplasmatota archaeon]
MAEKTVGGKNGRIHFEIDVELPEIKEGVMDILSLIKGASDEIVDLGKKLLNKAQDEPREIKKINIK